MARQNVTSCCPTSGDLLLELGTLVRGSPFSTSFVFHRYCSKFIIYPNESENHQPTTLRNVERNPTKNAGSPGVSHSCGSTAALAIATAVDLQREPGLVALGRSRHERFGRRVELRCAVQTLGATGWSSAEKHGSF